ncbi:hypothetical protein E3983_01100 [Legionella israelensis]|uniref:Tetratricopeptide repeat protein n=1 Tax=Legionella israelensis TaxID=454 RepID=A0AAX1ED85_9GAMM|nr:hypothetical protein [Legionella israelensis]QBR83076.1 hypothetical protein E3983_01100 [Legionella israelensis]
MKTTNTLFIKKQLRQLYQGFSAELKEAASEVLLECEVAIRMGDYQTACYHAQTLFKLAGKDSKEAKTLFHGLMFAEDVVTRDSFVLIHKESPYFESLKKLAADLNFSIKEHSFPYGYWTKDYVVSTGNDVLTPAKKSKDHYFTETFMRNAKQNDGLYYGKLQLTEHHQAKTSIPSALAWRDESQTLLDTSFVRKTALEGGNLFCAINKKGQRFYLVGENVISETMAYNEVDRTTAIDITIKELGCNPEQLLVIPQWAYHLDLQMAYLGHGQFIIHSFTQTDFNFNLSEDVQSKVAATFQTLADFFEKDIIDKTCQILRDNGFEIKKVFGCLFYLDDYTDLKQLKYVPFCKSSADHDGVLALMMNGFALDLDDNGRHFIVPRCDQDIFKEQFEIYLAGLGVNVQYVDMLEYYDYDDEFSGMAAGIMSANSVTDVVAFMNGSIRCQTSIVSKNLSPVYHLEQSKHRFFEAAKKLDLITTKTEDHLFLPEMK